MIIVTIVTGSTAIRRAEFEDVANGMVFIQGLECDGEESSLLDCPMDVELGFSLCDHSRDAGIRCHGLCSYMRYLCIVVPTVV